MVSAQARVKCEFTMHLAPRHSSEKWKNVPRMGFLVSINFCAIFLSLVQFPSAGKQQRQMASGFVLCDGGEPNKVGA